MVGILRDWEGERELESLCCEEVKLGFGYREIEAAMLWSRKEVKWVFAVVSFGRFIIGNVGSDVVWKWLFAKKKETIEYLIYTFALS